MNEEATLGGGNRLGQVDSEARRMTREKNYKQCHGKLNSNKALTVDRVKSFDC